MKITMYLLPCLALILFLTCDNTNENESEDKEFLNTLWTLESFKIEGKKIIPVEDQIYTIQFKEDSSFVAISDCNEIVGNYETKSSGLLIINIFATTKIYCGEESLDKKYYEALGVVRSYKIDKNRLYIYYGSNSKLIFTSE